MAMGMGELFNKISKCVVQVTLERPDASEDVICGIIVALKPSSAYIITDGFDPDKISHIRVIFPDGESVEGAQCYNHGGIVGITCRLTRKRQFVQTSVDEVELCEVDARPCQTVYVYNGIEETITDGCVTLIDGPYISVTNIADFHTEVGSPVINDNGMLIGVCSSFQHHLTARSIISITDLIERTHNRAFTSVQATSQYLHNLI